MPTYEISTCFMREASTLDAQLVADAVAEALPPSEDHVNGGAFFALETVEVFFGARRAHTNVEFTLKDVDYATARKVQHAVSKATGRGWNEPTQDMDERDAELDGKSTLGMFSAAGSLLLHAELDKLESQLRDGSLSPIKLDEYVGCMEDAISFKGHREVGDTEVREAIWARINRVLQELGIALVNR